MTEDDKLHLYKQGLKPDIRLQVEVQRHSSFNALKADAARVEDIPWRGRRAMPEYHLEIFRKVLRCS